MPPTAPESVIERTCSGAERRDRTSAVVSTGPAQNGTQGALACGKHARCRAALGTQHADSGAVEVSGYPDRTDA